MPALNWVCDDGDVDWLELSVLYRIAPLGEKAPDDLRVVFSNSRYKCFVYDGAVLVGAGRVLSDGLDCAYIADVAVHPDHQGRGLGSGIIGRLVELSRGHRKIILYAAPGREGFYRRLGFSRMTTAMAIFDDHGSAVASGIIEGGSDA